MTHLRYLDEKILSSDGWDCQVLDTSAINFDGAAEGRKSMPTLVRRAEDGEKIDTIVSGKVESTYVTKKGDAIFINLKKNDDGSYEETRDVFVPGSSDGSRLQFDDITKDYNIESGSLEIGEVTVKPKKTFRLLVGVIDKDTCIKDAWGPDAHQFLHAGATLKEGEKAGRVTGIDKEGFEKWEITKPAAPSEPGQAPGFKSKPIV